jgi:ATP-dependent Clp protease ATP-binding subunit ClpA
MPEPLSDEALQALDRARAEARALGHDRVGTEHVMLGLLGEAGGLPVRALGRLGAQPAAIRAELMRLIDGAGLDESGGGDRPEDIEGEEGATPPSFAAWLGAALTHASAEATADGRSIEVTDFLLALTHDPQSPAGWVLAELGVDAAGLRATAEHLRLLDREIARMGREMEAAAAASQIDRAAELRDQRRKLLAQRQGRRGPSTGEDPPAGG